MGWIMFVHCGVIQKTGQ